MTTSSTVMCESNAFNLGPWGLGWAHQREESPPLNPSILWWSCCFLSAKCHSDFPAICKLLSPKPSISSVIHNQHSSTRIIPCLLFCFMIPGLKVIWVPLCWKNWHCVWILPNAGDYRFRLESWTVLLQGFHLHWRSSILYAGFPWGQDNIWNQRA